MVFLRRFILLLVLVFTVLTESKLRNCKTTSECPDSGTVCKTAAPRTSLDSENEDDYTILVPETSHISAFDPPEESQGDESILSDDPIAVGDIVAADESNEISHTHAKLSWKKSADSTEIGENVLINGHKCVILNFNPSFKAGVLNDDTEAEVTGNGGTYPGLVMGKVLKIGGMTCKITGDLGMKTTPSRTTRATTRTFTVKGAAADNLPYWKKVRQQAVKVTSTAKPLPKIRMGRCICDQQKRFACGTNADCFERFQNESVQCQKSPRCASDLGYDSYCRLVPDQLLSDSLE